MPTPKAPHETWRDQCVAALSIQKEHGIQKALGYLVGEKLLHYVEAAETRPAFARRLPTFVATIREMFDAPFLREYLNSVKRVGAQGHVMDDETFEVARGMFHEDVVSAAEDVIRMASGNTQTRPVGNS
jgi:hypothetical protein